MESLLNIRIEGVSYLGRFQHTDRDPSLTDNTEVILYEPVILEMISVPATNPLTGQGQMAGVIQINHLHTKQLFVQLSFNYTYCFYSFEDNTNQIVQLYKNGWANIRKQSKGVH